MLREIFILKLIWVCFLTVSGTGCVASFTETLLWSNIYFSFKLIRICFLTTSDITQVTRSVVLGSPSYVLHHLQHLGDAGVLQALQEGDLLHEVLRLAVLPGAAPPLDPQPADTCPHAHEVNLSKNNLRDLHLTGGVPSNLDHGATHRDDLGRGGPVVGY